MCARVTVISSIAIALGGLASSQQANAAPDYSVTVMPPGTIFRNNNGAVVRLVDTNGGTSDRYTTMSIINGGSVVGTYTTSPGISDEPLAINDSEVVVGLRSGGSVATFHATAYSAGSFTDLHAAIASAFSFDSAASYSIANDINNLGDIVGSITMGSESYAYLYKKDGQVINLSAVAGIPIRNAASINNFGQITGSIIVDGIAQAYVYFAGQVKKMTYSSPSYPQAKVATYGLRINDAGQVLGRLSIPQDHLPSLEHLFLYEGGIVKDLGDGEGNGIVHYDMNNAGMVIGTNIIPHGGYFPFIYRDGVRSAITADTSAIQGRAVSDSLSINDDGNILANLSSVSGVLAPIVPFVPDPAVFNFEAGTQGWESNGQPIITLSTSTAQTFSGGKSLSLQFNDHGFASARVLNPSARPGDSISFRVYLPVDSRIDWVQPFLLGGEQDGWQWTGEWTPVGNLRLGEWNTLTVTVPSGAHPLHSLGVEAYASQSSAGTLWLDSVDYGSTIDSARFNFETGTQNWRNVGDPVLTVATSAANVFAGKKALALRFNGTGLARVSVANPSVQPGQIVSFHVFIPLGTSVDWIQPFALEDESGNWAWHGNWQPIDALRPGEWNVVSVELPSGTQGIASLGIELSVSHANANTVYVDSVSY